MYKRQSYQRAEDKTPYWRTLKANGELNAKYPGGIEAQKEKMCIRDRCYEKNWVTYCKETFNGAQSVINYLGKYTHRIAISNHRIKSMTDTTVTYVVKDYKNEGCWKEKTISGEEFIRRFMMHVPPKRFVRIRHYGLLSCRNKRKKDNSLQKPAWM